MARHLKHEWLNDAMHTVLSFFGGEMACFSGALAVSLREVSVPSLVGKPSLKLTANAPEDQWLEEEIFPFGARPIFRGVCC